MKSNIFTMKNIYLFPQTTGICAGDSFSSEINKQKDMKTRFTLFNCTPILRAMILMTLILGLTIIASGATKTWVVISGAWSTGMNWSPNGAPAAGDAVIINFGATIYVDVNPPTLLSITVYGYATPTLIASGANRILSLSNGTPALSIEYGSNLILDGSGSSYSLTLGFVAGGITETASIAGTLQLNTSGGGTVFDPSNSTTVVSGKLQNNGGLINNSSTSNLSFSNGGIYAHSIDGGTIPTATWNAASICWIDGVTATMPGGLGQSFGNFTWNCTGQTGADLNISPLATASGGSVGGNFSLFSTGTGSIRLTDGTSYSISISGNYSQPGGTFHLSVGTGTGTLNVAGNFSITGGTISETGTGSGSIVFNGTTPQTFTSGGTFSGTINFTVNNGAILMMGINSVLGSGSSGTFTLSSGGTLGIGDHLGITSSGANGNIRVTGTRTYNTGANYIYTGHDLQNTGNGFPATVNSLKIDNSGGTTGVTLASSVTVTTTLDMTNGLLTTGSNTVTIAAGGTIINASSTSYVDKNLARIFNATGPKTFTFGTGGTYYPMTLNYTGLTGTSTVSAVSYASGFPGSAPSGTAQVGTRYWHITQTGGSGLTYNITLDGTGLTFTTTPKILKYDSPNTVAYAATETPTTDYYTATGLTNFSDFGLGEETCTITLTSGTTSQTVCVNTPITDITYSTTIATGADFSGLPTGVTGTWLSDVVTISGTPSVYVASP